MRKLTPIALLTTAVTALYWKRRAIQAENRLTARVLAEEKEKAERGELLFQYNSDRDLSVIYTADGRRFVPDQREKKPDGFWDMFFSDEQPERSFSRTYHKESSDNIVADILNQSNFSRGGVVPDAPEGQKLSGLHDGCCRVPNEIADEIELTADEYWSKVNQELSEELNTCHCPIPEDMDPFRSFNRVPTGFNDDALRYREALRKVVCRCDSARGDSDE